MLHSWRAQAQLQAVHTCQLRRLQQRRMRKLLLAWQQQSAAQQDWLAWVQGWHCKKVQFQCYSHWREQVVRMQQLVQMHQSQWQATMLQQTLQVGFASPWLGWLVCWPIAGAKCLLLPATWSDGTCWLQEPSFSSIHGCLQA